MPVVVAGQSSGRSDIYPVVNRTLSSETTSISIQREVIHLGPVSKLSIYSKILTKPSTPVTFADSDGIIALIVVTDYLGLSGDQ